MSKLYFSVIVISITVNGYLLVYVLSLLAERMLQALRCIVSDFFVDLVCIKTV
jgi:hypothetical protein